MDYVHWRSVFPKHQLLAAATLPRCHVATLPRCHVATLPRCHVATLPRCHVATFQLRAHAERGWRTILHPGTITHCYTECLLSGGARLMPRPAADRTKVAALGYNQTAYVAHPTWNLVCESATLHDGVALTSLSTAIWTTVPAMRR
jgi:hypothetical protein